MDKNHPSEAPPGAWPAAMQVMRTLTHPLRRFLQVQAASGIVLIVAAIAALLWVNLGNAASYEHLWHVPLHIGIGGRMFTQSLHFWVNEGLMTLFFFVVGLEIRREIHEGELSDLRRATLPLAAALGGMVAPACIYLAINAGSPTQEGWGVPMATDIAFAVGVLALLGARVRPALRVLLLALAIVDDIGAILVIALFYATGFSFIGLGISALGVGAVLALRGFGVRNPWIYVPIGAVIWSGFLKAGIHPTLAGVILGLLTPVRPWYGTHGFVATVSDALARVRHRVAKHAEDPHALNEMLAVVREARREATAPVNRLEAALHPWVGFVIMPVFALANAGVSVRGVNFADPGAPRVIAGIVLGLVLGKPLGVLLLSFLVVRFGWASLPRGVTWTGVGVVGAVAGIGFTMAIFIAGLAFTRPGMLAAAKLAVLLGSCLAIGVALIAGRLLLAPRSTTEDSAPTVEAAEAATDY